MALVFIFISELESESHIQMLWLKTLGVTPTTTVTKKCNTFQMFAVSLCKKEKTWKDKG